MLMILIGLLAINNAVFAKGKRTRAPKPLTLQEFTTDGCSAYPDGYPHTEEYEWLHCCVSHDMKYWMGGTYEEKVQADLELNQCVSEATFTSHGKMMEMGVAAGGTAHLGTSWRWGYGWNKKITYEELSEDQLKQVDKLSYTILNEVTMNSQYLTEEQIDYIIEEFKSVRQKSIIVRLAPKE
jgi:hypothetical protein